MFFKRKKRHACKALHRIKFVGTPSSILDHFAGNNLDHNACCILRENRRPKNRLNGKNPQVKQPTPTPPGQSPRNPSQPEKGRETAGTKKERNEGWCIYNKLLQERQPYFHINFAFVSYDVSHLISVAYITWWRSSGCVRTVSSVGTWIISLICGAVDAGTSSPKAVAGHLK